MTLAAAILLFGVSSLASFHAEVTVQSSAAATSTEAKPVPQEQGPQKSAEPAQANKAPSDQTSNSQSKATGGAKKRARIRKKAVTAKCDAAAGSAAGTNASGSTDTSTTSGDPQKNCPPPKIVVHQGGIAEQSIQLAGGSSDDANQKRDAANKMLASTEANLKAIGGRQLTAEQEGSASQIRQFVVQSKSALAAGDLERAQTLAWKAKLLSDDLVNPGK